MGLFSKVIGTHSEREVKRVIPIVDKIESLEPEMEKLSDEELRGKTAEFKKRLADKETLDDILPEAYAVVRDVLPRRAFHPLVGVQYLVQNEELALVARHHAGGERLFFAVQLDLVLPQGLVQAARIQRRELLHQIIVQPGGGQTFHFQNFHEKLSSLS